MAGNPIQRLRFPAVRKPLLRAGAGDAAHPAAPMEAIALTTEVTETNTPKTIVSSDPVSAGEATLGKEPVSTRSPAQSPEIPLNPSILGDFDADSLPNWGTNEATDDLVPSTQPTAQARLSAQLRRGVRLLGAPLAWLTLLALCGGTSVSAFFWLTTLPPVPDCKQLHPFVGDSDRLYCADQAAKSGDPAAIGRGFKLVKSWPADHPLRTRANELMRDWARSLLLTARQRADQDKLDEAIALAKKIPAGLPAQRQAEVEIAAWQKNRDRGQAIGQTIETLLKAQNWVEADAQIQELSKLSGDYWRQYASRMRQRVLAERLARRQLEQVHSVAETAAGNLEILSRAIGLIQQMNPNTYAYAEVKSDLTRLGESLAALVSGRLAQGEVPGAIAAAQAFPAELPMPAEVQSVIGFSRAQAQATTDISLKPLHEQLWQLWTVLPAVQKIGAESPLYPQAQALVNRLQLKIQDLHQIQLASAIAQIGSRSALQNAIALAATVTIDRPQRLYAQTLMADWRLKMQQVEDRPYLVAAQQLAKAGAVKPLQSAIAIASRIQPGRALRPQAQNAIFDWQQQIQTIEDKPFLTQAQNFAKQKKLKEAVQSAAKIQPGRSLYKDAQALMLTWTAQIQTEEDRPILNQAIALADQGNLAAAINTAAQIAPDRALTGEAQAAIAKWDAQIAQWQAQQEASRKPRRPADEPIAPIAPPEKSIPLRTRLRPPADAPDLPPT